MNGFVLCIYSCLNWNELQLLNALRCCICFDFGKNIDSSVALCFHLDASRFASFEERERGFASIWYPFLGFFRVGVLIVWIGAN